MRNKIKNSLRQPFKKAIIWVCLCYLINTFIIVKENELFVNSQGLIN